MSETRYTIIESWPGLKEDLGDFLSDTDAWIISELKQARINKDWITVERIIDFMEFLHNINHEH